MLAKTKSAAPISLDDVQRDLAEAQTKLTTINDSERSALSSASAFNTWKAERDAVALEADRLTRLAERLEADAAAKAQAEKQAALQKRVDAQRAANRKLADRIRSEGGKAVEVLLELVRDVAAAEAIDEELTAALPRDAEPIVGADMLARASQATPRETISEKEIALWCFAETGALIGNQDEVVWLSNERGSLRGAQRGIPAIKRKFRQVEYYPAARAEYDDPFIKALRLPLMDRPGYAWDPSDAVTPAEALQTLANGGAERQTMTELTPIEPFKPEYRR